MRAPLVLLAVILVAPLAHGFATPAAAYRPVLRATPSADAVLLQWVVPADLDPQFPFTILRGNATGAEVPIATTFGTSFFDAVPAETPFFYRVAYAAPFQPESNEALGVAAPSHLP